MGLSVLVSVAATWGPLPVLSLLNLLPPGSCTRLQWQMLLLVQLPVVPGPLSHMLHSALLSFVSFSLLCWPMSRACACCGIIVGAASLRSVLEA